MPCLGKIDCLNFRNGRTLLNFEIYCTVLSDFLLKKLLSIDIIIHYFDYNYALPKEPITKDVQLTPGEAGAAESGRSIVI